MYQLPLCLLFFVCINADDLFGLQVVNNQMVAVVSIDPDFGNVKQLVSLKDIAPQFNSLINITWFDANSDAFIIGNALPPIVALVNTFAKTVRIIKLPEYGKLLSVTAYDGIAYCLLGADEDLPTTGSVVAIDLQTLETTRYAKFKLLDNLDWIQEGSSITYLPHKTAWLIELKSKDTNKKEMYFVINVANQTQLIEVGLESEGYTQFWFDVNVDNQTLIGYKNGLVNFINIQTGDTESLTDFECPGILALNFGRQEVYHIANCTGRGFKVDTVSYYYNKTMSSVDLAADDAAILIGIHSSGVYTPFKCGMDCKVMTDCMGSRTCPTCRLGKCTASGECAAFCSSPKDCFAGVCVNNCENNRCGRRGCGEKCVNNEQCKEVSTSCVTCRLGKCVDYGNCGAYCQTNMDCYAGACANKCVNFMCSQ